MGGRGASSSGATTLSATEKAKISKGIATHSVLENDRVENFYKSNIEREKKVVSSAKQYIQSGQIKSTSDEWFQDHIKSYSHLKAQYSYFKKERKKQGR